jgi:murein DD-endopeptidase MepM/ murein hydrolase activator NlpD
MFVSKGQTVSAGCIIGLMGHTGGNVDQEIRQMDRNLTHLHYEIVYSGKSSFIQTPTNTKIPIIRGGNCGNFKNKIKPNEIMIYNY